jgi:fructokinase
MEHMMRIGVDVGGTKIEAALMDNEGVLTARRRSSTPRNGYVAAVEAIVDLVKDVEKHAGQPCSVGFSIPGTISLATGKVKNAPNSPFNGHYLDKDIANALGRPVRMMNDANCFALSEAVDGAAAGANIVFGVILGTGCGGGVIIDGKPLIGGNAISGEWGHNPMPWMSNDEFPGPACKCGQVGCIETFLSGTGFQAHHLHETGNALAPEDIAAGAARGDKICDASLTRYENRLARALASVINMIDPDVIVLGGGVSNINRLYQNVPRYWTQWVFSDHVSTKLVAPKYGDSSGVRGAAWLWPTDSNPDTGFVSEASL